MDTAAKFSIYLFLSNVWTKITGVLDNYGELAEQLYVMAVPGIWLDFGYIILLGTVVAFAFWYQGIKETTPVKTVVFLYLTPIVSMASGWLWLCSFCRRVRTDCFRWEIR